MREPVLAKDIDELSAKLRINASLAVGGDPSKMPAGPTSPSMPTIIGSINTSNSQTIKPPPLTPRNLIEEESETGSPPTRKEMPFVNSNSLPPGPGGTNIIHEDEEEGRMQVF